jgi:signal transduction histidine kinase
MEREQSPYAGKARELCDRLSRLNQDIRLLSRGLVPVRVSSGSFLSALEELAGSTARQHGVTCALECSDSIIIEDDFIADQLYHIAQEAITNALKHADADTISVKVFRKDNGICVEVTDNGKGFDTAQVDADGLGLHIMPYRAVTIGGELKVFSPLEKGGTTVRCCIP